VLNLRITAQEARRRFAAGDLGALGAEGAGNGVPGCRSHQEARGQHFRLAAGFAPLVQLVVFECALAVHVPVEGLARYLIRVVVALELAARENQER
jgi:hypothetical protein